MKFIDLVINLFKTNPIFAGLSASMLTGSVLYLCKAVPRKLGSLFIKQCTISLTVQNSDDAFNWLNEWLSTIKYAKKSRILKLFNMRSDFMQWGFSPGYGTHIFWHKTLVILTRIDESDKSMSYTRKEKFEIRILGRSQRVLRSIIEDASTLKDKKDEVDIKIFSNGYWQDLSKKDKRDLNTIFLEQSQKDLMINDVDWFFRSRHWYLDRGIPYRRGYLLHGLPGSGKSSIVLALASKFKKTVYYINLNTVPDDNALTVALMTVKTDSIVLIEDIDAVSISQNRKPSPKIPSVQSGSKPPDEEKTTAGITLSGLLNATDGLAASENRLLIMTTNHIDKLDPALIRGGRIDQKFYFGHMAAEQVLEMFTAFFPNSLNHIPLIKSFAKTPRVAAEWQGLFMSCHNDVSKLIGSLNQLDRVLVKESV